MFHKSWRYVTEKVLYQVAKQIGLCDWASKLKLCHLLRHIPASQNYCIEHSCPFKRTKTFPLERTAL